MKPENACAFLGTSVFVYVTPEGLNDVMFIETRTGARDGPPTVVPAVISALTGAATRGATRCVSCNLLVTDGGTKALLTIVCTFAVFPFPPLLVFFLGAPYGTSPEALGGADLVFVCSK